MSIISEQSQFKHQATAADDGKRSNVPNKLGIRANKSAHTQKRTQHSTLKLHRKDEAQSFIARM